MVRKTTIRDVAERAGVSISVVSYVLNETRGKTISEETAARVREAAASLRYTPNRIAQSMRLGRSRMIAFVTYQRLGEYVGLQILSGAYEAASAAGYQMVFINPGAQTDTAYLDPYRRNQIDGLLLLEPFMSAGLRFDEEPHLAAVGRYGIPSVFINGQGNGRVRNFRIDLEPTTYMAARYLAGKGYRLIDYVRPGESETGLPRTLDRQRGYRRAMEEFSFTGEEITPARLRGRLAEILRGASYALVVCKANYVGEALGCVRDAGLRVPEDVAVISCSYEPDFLANQTPSVSYVRVPTLEIGRESCRYLLALIEGKRYEPVVPEPDLHVRESG